MLKIDKSIYKDKYKIERTDKEIILPSGYFALLIQDLEVSVTIEPETRVFITDEIEEDDRHITLIYGKGNKIFHVEPKEIEVAKVAEYLDDLVGGKAPFTTVSSLYMKFFKTLKKIGSWDSVHLEVVISNILRNRDNPQLPARLKKPFDPIMISIKNLPSTISWPLGLAFEDFSKSIRHGLISERAPASPIEKVMFGESLALPKK